MAICFISKAWVKVEAETEDEAFDIAWKIAQALPMNEGKMHSTDTLVYDKDDPEYTMTDAEWQSERKFYR